MSEWWQDFFRGLWQEAQLGVWTEDDNRAAAEKIERVLRLTSQAKVLDVPCGGGRISLELAARGFDVTGVDLNETFLAKAARRAEERGLSARWERADMRDISFESEFKAALNFWGSFGYFDESDNERTAASVYRSLVPGGGSRPTGLSLRPTDAVSICTVPFGSTRITSLRASFAASASQTSRDSTERTWHRSSSERRACGWW